MGATDMDIINTPESFQEQCWQWRGQGLRTALVPTMGFLHQGHLSLIRLAREKADRVMVSLFVNPTQFGPNEDLDAYPRDFERDCKLAAEAGADLLFAPAPETMYASDASTWVVVDGPSQGLCATTRPHPFSRRDHRGRQALHAGNAQSGRVRQKGLSAAGRHPPHGARPEHAH